MPCKHDGNLSQGLTKCLIRETPPPWQTSSPFWPQVHKGRVTRSFAARETVDTAFALPGPGLTLGLALYG